MKNNNLIIVGLNYKDKKSSAKNFLKKLNNPYKIDKPLIQTSQDPRIQAEGKAGQSADKGIIFVTESNFESEAGSEWVIGTCVKSPCVAAGNNELVSAYR